MSNQSQTVAQRENADITDCYIIKQGSRKTVRKTREFSEKINNFDQI